MDDKNKDADTPDQFDDFGKASYIVLVLHSL